MPMRMSLSEFSDWYRERTSEKIQPIYEEIRRITDDCSAAQVQLRERCEKLANASRNFSTETSDRERSAKNASRLADSIKLAASRIRFPREHLYDELKQFSDSITDTVFAIHDAGRRFVPGLRGHFKPEVSSIDTVVKILASEQRRIDDLLKSKYLEAKKAEDLSRLIQLAHEDEKKTVELAGALRIAVATLESEKKELEAKKSQLQAFEGTGYFKQLETAGVELSTVKERFYSFFSPLEKPLRKAEKLASEGTLFMAPEARRALREYLSDPYQSFLRVETHEPFHAALQAILPVLEQDKLELKDSKKRKTLILIKDTLADGLLTKLYQQHLGLLEDERRISERMHSDENYAEYQEVRHAVDLLQDRIRSVQREQEELQQKIATLKEINETRVRDIEKGLARLLAQPVEITLLQ